MGTVQFLDVCNAGHAGYSENELWDGIYDMALELFAIEENRNVNNEIATLQFNDHSDGISNI